MIFAQYKHAITFAVVMLALAVVVADPGNDDAGDAAQAVAPAPLETDAQPRPAHTIAPADPEWYGDTADGGEPAVTPEDAEAAGYAAAQTETYVPPPPPPQNFQP